MRGIICAGIVLSILLICFVSSEEFQACYQCDKRMPINGVSVLNPFVWPYSGTPHVDDLYILNHDSGVDLGFTGGPLYSLNTPDHIELI